MSKSRSNWLHRLHYDLLSGRGTRSQITTSNGSHKLQNESYESVPLPSGGGEMGQLIKKFKWVGTALGPLNSWPQVLRILVDLMLNSSQPMFIVWGTKHTLLYNDAYAEILASKHPALGLPFDRVWNEIWETDLEPIVKKAYAGEALHMDNIPLKMMRKGYLEETNFSFSYTPVRDHKNVVQGFLCPCLEITEQVLEQRRARLRAEMTDKFRALRDPVALSFEAAALVAKYLGVEQSAYAEIDETGEFALIENDWNDGAIASNAGRHRLQDFGAEFVADLKVGCNIAIADVREDPRTSTPEAAEAFEKRGIRAFLNIPHVRDGRLVAVLAVHSAKPKHWHPADIVLVEEVAERTHAAVESAKSEAARRVSEKNLHETRDALALATTASSLGWATWDFVSGAASLDACGREIMGFDEGEITGADWMNRVHPEDRDRLIKEVRNCVRERRPFDLEYQVIQPDGSLRHVHGTGIFEADADGEPALGTGFVRDVTERKNSEAHQNMLMAELDHRVKNILAIVQSITRQSLKRGQDAGPEAAERLIGRISALAQSHSLLARSRWEGASFKTLVEDVVAPYIGDGVGCILVEGPELKVTPKAAQALTLALHELVTNAAKYGALSRQEGRVTAEWHLSGKKDDCWLNFRWEEVGGPTIDSAPSRKGFGSVLIESMLSADLGGKVALDFARSGLRATIDLPLANLRAKDGQTTPAFSSAKPLIGDPRVLQGKTVLVVEDEHLVGRETTAALQAAGCVVIGPISTIEEALNVVRTEPFDAAVLDINLNGELVWPAAQVVRARKVPFIFTTGYSGLIDVPTELKDALWIEKPFNGEQLTNSLAATVAGKVTEK